MDRTADFSPWHLRFIPRHLAEILHLDVSILVRVGHGAVTGGGDAAVARVPDLAVLGTGRHL